MNSSFQPSPHVTLIFSLHVHRRSRSTTGGDKQMEGGGGIVWTDNMERMRGGFGTWLGGGMQN